MVFLLVESYSIGLSNIVAIKLRHLFLGLARYPDFITPFLIACSTRNAKYSATAVQCLHTLINFEGLPPNRLVEVLDALKEATHLGVEIHLKILQSLPSLIQNYGDYLSNNLIVELLLICYILQGGNKVPVVVNTALATLQQLIISVFDKVVKEDSLSSPLPKTFEVAIENNDKTLVSPAAYDALRVFFDICNLIERQKPVFLKFGHLPETVSLELIESILTAHSDLFSSHPEFRYVIRTRAVPILLRAFSEKRDFPVTVRVTRVLYLIIRRLLPVLDVECEVILSLLTHMLDYDAAPYWKRVLCMEVFQGVSLEFSLIESIYSEFDRKDGHKPIIKGWISALDKLSAEQPAVIGLGNVSQQMEIPDLSRQQSDPSSNATPIDLSQIPGISTKTSLVRSSCIDLLDKTEPPNLPPSYLYYLALTCVNSFSEGVGKGVQQSSTSESQARKKQQKHSHHIMPSQSEILADSRSRSASPKRDTLQQPDRASSSGQRTDSFNIHLALIASLIESIWPQMLSTFATFFRSTMDNEMYHTLVRSAQKFTHASGILTLIQPRDAYLALLGRFSITLPEPENDKSQTGLLKQGLLSMEGIVGSLNPNLAKENSRTQNYSTTGGASSASIANASTSTHASRPKMTARNILSFRALINLGIALGHNLGSGWSVLLETMQYVDFLIYGAAKDRRRGSDSKGISNYDIEKAPLPFSGLGSEFSSAEHSVKRLLDSTKDYSPSALKTLTSSIGFLSARVLNVKIPDSKITLVGIGNPADCDPYFLLDFLGAVCYRNSFRFVSLDTQESQTWHTITRFFIAVETSRDTVWSSRIRACQIHNEVICKNSIEYFSLEKESASSTQLITHAQRIIFESLLEEIQSIVSLQVPLDGSISILSTEATLHVTCIDYLNKLLTNCGGTLNQAWDLVFDIIGTVFNWFPGGADDMDSQSRRHLVDRSIQLLKSGFTSLDLISSDFLELLPSSCIIRFIDTLYNFCHQEGDLNISFTSLSFFWSLSGYLRNTLGDDGSVDISKEVTSTEELVQLSESQNRVDSINGMWMVSLLRLATITYDPRPQVRNGATQTLFRIFEANGSKLPPRVWKACHSVVLEKVMQNDPFKDETKVFAENEIKEWEETLTLVFSQIGNIFSTFLPQFIDKRQNFDVRWKKLLQYFEKFVSRGNFTVIHAVYKSFNTVLSGFQKSELKMSTESLDNTWNFWTSQKVLTNTDISKQNSVQFDAKSAQECYTELSKGFGLLKSLTSNEEFTEKRISKSVELLKKCVTYPLLAPFYSDKDRMSPLQMEALEQIESINCPADFTTTDLIISLYSDFIVLAFQPLPENNDEKGNKNGFKYPTFVALTQRCLIVLETKFEQSKEFTDKLILQGTIEKLVKSLLVAMKNKMCPPYIKVPVNAKDSGTESGQLWQLADCRFVEVMKASLFVIKAQSYLSSNDDTVYLQLWDTFSTSIVSIISPGFLPAASSRPTDSVLNLPESGWKETLGLPSDFVGSLEKYELFDIDIFKQVMDMLLNPFFFESPVDTKSLTEPNDKANSVANLAPTSFWRILFMSIFLHSLIYEMPRLETIILAYEGDEKKVIKSDSISTSDESDKSMIKKAGEQLKWILNNSYFGSTERLRFKSRQSLSFLYLDYLAQIASANVKSKENELASSNNEKEDKLLITVPDKVRQLGSKLLTLRLAMVLYLYVSDQPLRGRQPMPKVQRKELVYILTLVFENIPSGSQYGEQNTFSSCADDCSLAALYPLLVKAVPIAEKDNQMLALLQSLLMKIGNVSGYV